MRGTAPLGSSWAQSCRSAAAGRLHRRRVEVDRLSHNGTVRQLGGRLEAVRLRAAKGVGQDLHARQQTTQRRERHVADNKV